MDYLTHARLNDLAQALTAEDGDTFNPTLAVELRELLEPQKLTGWQLRVMKETSGDSVSGLATAGGAGQYDGGTEKKTLIDTSPKKIWAGSFALRREDALKFSFVSIEDRFLNTREIDNQEREWLIEYRNEVPVKMSVRKNYVVRFSLFNRDYGFSFGRLVKYKSPAKI